MKKIIITAVCLLLLVSMIPYDVSAMIGDNELNNGEVVQENQVDEESDLQNNENDESIEEKDINDEADVEEGIDYNNPPSNSEVNSYSDENLENDSSQKMEPTESNDIVNEKQDTKENTLLLQSISNESIEEKFTSKLGHIKSANVVIFQDLTDLSTSFKADEANTNEVYYIKKEAKTNSSTYYLLSREPSSTKGLLGWVEESDLSLHTHTGVDKEAKTFYFKGTGSSYNKAWGGSKNVVYKSMEEFTGQKFLVNLTEKVGNNTWYRGNLNGETIWLHSSYLTAIEKTTIEESKTSLLGHLKSQARIYKEIGVPSSAIEGNDYLHAVYYIKKRANFNGETYYLISQKPSSVEGVVGWVKSSDLSTHTHVGVDKRDKTFYFKGTGSAYSKAWGGSKDLIYKDMSQFQGKRFEVHLTEKVGNNTWYRGNINGETIWLHSSYVESAEEQSTSKLGHIRSEEVIIYDKNDFSSSWTAGTKYTNSVYYIKKQVDFKNKRYYLISTEPSSTKGVVGLVKGSDLSLHDHVGIDKKIKSYYFKGNGSSYGKAWGGSKDLVYDDMAQFKGQKFIVNLTEKVGTNTWYRGEFNGETIWLHSSYLTTKEESDTSLLGHLKSGAKIYEEIGDVSSSLNTINYLNAVYYIKKQAEINGEFYYLISNQPSSVKGVIGWVKASDLAVHTHVGVDKESKIFYLNGKGSAYQKAWGGSKDLIYKDLSSYEGSTFKVNLTESVGSNIWYRGLLDGTIVWIHSSYLLSDYTNYSNYDLKLSKALELQMELNSPPQTDKKYAYVSAEYINNQNEVTASVLNVRSGPGGSKKIVGSLKYKEKVNIISKVNGWYQIEYTSGQWVDASQEDVLYYLDPTNFVDDEKQRFQFLDLARTSGTSTRVIDNYLKGKGILEGKGETFIEAGLAHGVNDIYLLSHALLETGHGSSPLANGVEVGINKSGNYVLVTSTNKNSLSSIKKTYNMFGIGAVDGNALEAGAIRAYKEKWFSAEEAIIGGAKFIGESYVNKGQNTLYKMRWNPEAMAVGGQASHQYATDIGWASKQIYTMYNLYQDIGIYNIFLDIPSYN
ncbi:GW dipeptide domain-containing protein [Oceanobacillus jordanicus]|uniref:GW dipeptide domain-containing protein n=1 Tax=Oceanobacillus jordanicus TaxID=2867266 RepID=A0AAW5B222_9BACI|nr:GW dipeptide domain-containing protein [Oceanobacillus jordanicus]MCG3418018.1 GW dipeptide domain-containing protein [Oceanobacillus jordanicus]